MLEETQNRYLKHQQENKKKELIAIMEERHSNRRFSTSPVPQELVQELVDSTALCPSSCDRHGVRIKVVTERDDKDLLGGLLVGGVGWCHRAPVILLLFANKDVYLADGGREAHYNSYLDAGIMVQQLYLLGTASGLHCTFVNPNIRDANKGFFETRFAPWENSIFCGAFCFGWPHTSPMLKNRNPIKTMKAD